MIQNSEIMLNEFSKHFNARFNTLDFIENVDKLIDIINKKRPLANLKHFIKLPFGSERTFQQLVSFEYPRLVLDIIRRVRIEPESYDNFRSEMEPMLIELYADCLVQMANVTNLEIKNSDRMLYIECPELLMELLWSPISQFHTSVISELEHFNQLLDTFSIFSETSNNQPNLFLNSKVATPFSYFIIAFVAENLNIPLSI